MSLAFQLVARRLWNRDSTRLAPELPLSLVLGDLAGIRNAETLMSIGIHSVVKSACR